MAKIFGNESGEIMGAVRDGLEERLFLSTNPTPHVVLEVSEEQAAPVIENHELFRLVESNGQLALVRK